MSASKDKILRKQQIEAGTDKRSIAAAEEAKKRRKSNITYAVVAVLLVIAFAFIFTYNSPFPSRHTTAVTIGEQDYTVAQLNYYYACSYMAFYESYGQFISYGLFFDPQTSLADQMYSEDMTWRQYFLDSAVASMTEVQVLNDAAAEAGFVLSEEDQAEYDSTVKDIEEHWSDLGYSSLQQYINMNYGTGVDMDLIRTELYRAYVASAYSKSVYDSYEYSVEDLTAYYAEHADEFDMIQYAYYADYDGTADADAAVAAVDGSDEETFHDYIEDTYAAEINSATDAGSNLNETYSAWLLDAARQPGDASSFTDETNSVTYVVMFLGRDTNDYHPVSFRHILKNAVDEDGDGSFSETEIAEAASAAQEVYDAWLAGDATEDSFAELANAESDDGGSNTTGGLYETVAKGQMVEPIDAWIFDDARQPGDTEILSYDGSNYTGTHVVYFVGTDDMTYAQSVADSAMRDEAYNDWLNAAKDAVSVTTSHLRMAGKNH